MTTVCHGRDVMGRGWIRPAKERHVYIGLGTLIIIIILLIILL